jgi:hypothetical protein
MNKLMSCLPLVCSLRNGSIVVGIGGGDYTDEWMDKATTFLDRSFSLSKIV